MKKILCFALVLVFACVFCACGDGEQNGTTLPDITTTTAKTTTTTTKIPTTTTEFVPPVTQVTEDGYIYTQDDGGVVVVGYNGTQTSIEIPQTVGGKQVVEIGFEAFKNSKVKSVVVPFGVKKIGAFAFYQSSLEWIEIPETVTLIGNNAFSYTNLTEFETPMGISVVSAEMLSFCDRLESVIISSNITQVDYGAFSFCMSLEAVYVPYEVEYISDDAFEGCFDLILYGEEDSYAEQFAEDMELTFEIV